jgi:hypothetical protein
MGVAGLVTLISMEAVQLALRGLLAEHGRLAALLDIAVVGAVGLVAYVLMARILHIAEVTEMVAVLRRRLPGAR